MDNQKTLITQRVREVINHETGEIETTETENIQKLPQTPDFTMLFTQDIGFIASISAPASKLLFGILTKIDRSNEITLVKEKKEQIAKMIGIKASTVNKLVTELYQARILLKQDTVREDGKITRSATYTINPYYFGKGKWVNINKLRMLIEYDFVKGKKTFGIETEYIDEKDDYIGQLIEHQDMVLEQAEKMRNSQNVIDIEPVPAIASSPIKNEPTPTLIQAQVNNISKQEQNPRIEENKDKDYERLRLENENLRLQLELRKLKEKHGYFTISEEDKDF